MDAGVVVALVGLGLSTTGMGIAALWKLATMLAEVRTTINGELAHNGGGSTKDYARAARDEAINARRAAEHAHQRLDALERQVLGLRVADGVRIGLEDGNHDG